MTRFPGLVGIAFLFSVLLIGLATAQVVGDSMPLVFDDGQG